MANTVARTKKTVDQMSGADRLWDSLNYSYGKKREDLTKQINQGVSQTQNALLKRGMQRSSYGQQIAANQIQEGNKQLGDVWDTQIADYENRLQEQENQDWQRDFQERQLAEQKRQFNEGQAWQSSENALNRAFQTSEREGQQTWQSGENALARAFQTSERLGQQAYSTSEREASQLYNTGEREAQQAWQSGENKANREQSQSQFEANLNFQKEEAARDQKNTEWQQNYQVGRDAVTDEQWQKAFDQDAATNDQSLAQSYVSAIIASGQMPSDDLLARAGISAEDAQKMLATAAEASNSGPIRSVSDQDTNGNDDSGDSSSGQNSWSNFLTGLTAGLQSAVQKTKSTNSISTTPAQKMDKPKSEKLVVK